jgi:sulfate adenylyltransferase subunit 1
MHSAQDLHDRATPGFDGRAAHALSMLRSAASDHAGQSAGPVLDRQLDDSRSDWMATHGSFTESRRCGATLAWLDTEAARIGGRYWLRHGNRWVQARIDSIGSRLDMHTLQPAQAHALAVNEIGRVTIELQQALPLQPLASNRVGGSLIGVDPTTHCTRGALPVDAVTGRP